MKTYDSSKDVELALKNKIAETKNKHAYKIAAIKAKTEHKIAHLNNLHAAEIDSLERQLKKAIMDKMTEAEYVYEASGLKDMSTKMVADEEEPKVYTTTVKKNTSTKPKTNSNKK